MSAALAAVLMVASPMPVERERGPEPHVEVSLMAPVLRVADCGKAQEFYEVVLGMNVLMSRDFGRIHETMMSFAGKPDATGIMLVCSAEATIAPKRAIGGSRLIINIARLDPVIALLDAHRISHAPALARDRGVRVLNLQDPDGNDLELVQLLAATDSGRP